MQLRTQSCWSLAVRGGGERVSLPPTSNLKYLRVEPPAYKQFQWPSHLPRGVLLCVGASAEWRLPSTHHPAPAQSGANQNTAENAAAEVASSARSQLGVLWARSGPRLWTPSVSQRLLRINRVACCCTSATSGQLFLLVVLTPLQLDVFSAVASSPLSALWTP